MRDSRCSLPFGQSIPASILHFQHAEISPQSHRHRDSPRCQAHRRHIFGSHRHDLPWPGADLRRSARTSFCRSPANSRDDTLLKAYLVAPELAQSAHIFTRYSISCYSQSAMPAYQYYDARERRPPQRLRYFRMYMQRCTPMYQNKRKKASKPANHVQPPPRPYYDQPSSPHHTQHFLLQQMLRAP